MGPVGPLGLALPPQVAEDGDVVLLSEVGPGGGFGQALHPQV